MGGRNGRRDREGSAGAGRAQGHEEGKQQVDGQADRQGEAEQGDQGQQQAGEQDGALGAALVYPAAAQAHGGHAGEAAAQIEGGDLLARETEVELEVVRKVRDQQEVAEHLQTEDAQGPLTERRAQQLAQPLALRGAADRQRGQQAGAEQGQQQTAGAKQQEGALPAEPLGQHQGDGHHQDGGK